MAFEKVNYTDFLTLISAKNMNDIQDEIIRQGDDLDLVKDITDKLEPCWEGKTAAFYGDSLTEKNYHYTKGYHKWVQELLELASYYNYGKSGWGYADIYNKVCNVVDPADIVFVGAGVNEQTYSVALGTITDSTTDTTYGRLNLLCAKLRERYPTSIIVFITPTYQTKYPHNEGITSYEVSRAVREVCEKFAIPVFDNFIQSGINEKNLSTFTTDNCHWNDTAHEMVGKNLAHFIANGFRYCHGFTPKNEWIGKTITCEKHTDAEAQYVNFIALVAADSDMVQGAVVSRSLSGIDCVNMISNSYLAGNIYGDNTGEVNNGAYTSKAHSPITMTLTVNSDNTCVGGGPDVALTRDVTEAYIKVPILLFGSYPFSFRISDISVKVNGKEKPILALGAFFKPDKEIITVS